MTQSTGNPTLEARQLKDGSAYYILVKWPDGAEEHFTGFSTEDEANDWIATSGPDWVKQRIEQRFPSK